MNFVKCQQLKSKFNELNSELDKLKQSINLEQLKNKQLEFEEKVNDVNFWNSSNKAKAILKQISVLKHRIKNFEQILKLHQDCEFYLNLAEQENDEEALTELEVSLTEFEKNLEHELMSILLNGEFDENNAIVTLNSGAGGVESMDWVEMLFRMYSKWSEQHKFKLTVLNYVSGEEAGIKNISFLVEGLNTYGYLKSESGVHRLVRISPFDSSGRRHTSFASIEVIPEIDDDSSVDLNEDDLKTDVFRASGAGGQHVNKTSSAVRLTHIPTGIVVVCQNERSQIQNRTTAMKILKSKLIEIKHRQHLEKIEDIKGEQKEIAWGSQIRSYIFMPYTLVKDHRTNFEEGNVNAVMDGKLDGFINSYLIWQAKELKI